MKRIILSCDVSGLGKSGDVVTVQDGYARNFLFPRKLALEATSGNLRVIEERKKAEQQRVERERRQAQELARKISNISLTISVQAKDDDTLYGSVMELDIAKAFETEGIKIDKRKIQLQNSIEKLGIYQVAVQLHPEIATKVKLWVVRK